MALITASEYKGWSSLPDSYDTLIGVLIGQAEALLYQHLGVASLEEATYTDATATGYGTSELRVKNWPITAVSAVKYRGSGSDTTTLTATSYRFDEERPVIHTLGDWCWSRDAVANYLVTYTAGYATVPDRVKNVMYRLVDWLMKTRRRDIFTEASAGLGSSSWAARAQGDTIMAIEHAIGQLKPEVFV